jgi:vitamin-K-epoxide reductase (warfarin-sensitive)
MNSEYGHMLHVMGLVSARSVLNQSNSFYGALFYVMCGVVSCIRTPQGKKLLFYMSLVSMVITMGLAYLMYAVIKAVCIVCIGTYICNTIFLVTAWIDYRRSSNISQQGDSVQKKNK